MTRFFRINIISLLMVLLIGVILSSCRDDLLYDNSIIGDGESKVSVELSFTPMGSALNTRSDGEAVKDINNLCVVIYKSNGEFYDKFMANQLDGYSCDQLGNTQYPADSLKYQDGGSNFDYIKNPKTPKATFDVRLPYGKYRMYAVANLGMLSDEITENEEALKAHRVSWNPDISSDKGVDGEEYNGDHAMFGYFTQANDTRSMGFDAPDLVIDKPNISLHCWIKRVVSKVTIAFDPSGLKESVHIYIKSVTIHDIPKSCCLGEDNKPVSEGQLYPTGETINYFKEGNENNIDSWLHLMTGSGIQGAKNHTEEDDALFFFENMQGNYEGQPDYYKPQIKTGESINEAVKDEYGNIINDFKDKVEFGTYIEVKAYYDSQNDDNRSSGPITYRFMLGKNTTYNYNAERNYHYKLTLKFKGWANEPDWHIVYEEPEPTIFLPMQYYISYLYNQEMVLPVRIKGLTKTQRENYYLKSEIIENNWIPYDPETRTAPDSQIEPLTDLNGFAWDEASYNSTYSKVIDGVRKPDNYVGFLSVRKNDATIVGNTMTFGPDANKALEKYYYGEEADFNGTIIHVNPRDVAYYYLDTKSDDIAITPAPGTQVEDDGKYSVTYLEKTSEEDLSDTRDIIVRVPFYTRAKELVSATDFTANNPFYAYQRKAVVRFSLIDKTTDKVIPIKVMTDESKEPEEVLSKEFPIYQVRRIVNPKGIWRAHNNNQEFHVKLMHLSNGGSTKFEPFTSSGKWRVSVIQDPKDLIRINGKKLSSTDYIEGTSDTEIDFTYKPNGTIGKNETRCGIIKVEYHDYTCTHLIFVRQGYNAPVELGIDQFQDGVYYSRKAKWSCYNAVAAEGNGTSTAPTDETTRKVYVTKSPLSIGSFFKRCQYNYAILESNNETYKWLQAIGPLKTAYINNNGEYIERNGINWKDFGGYSWNSSVGDSRYDKSWATNWDAINLDDDVEKTQFAFPTIEHYRGLRDGCEYGYGIVYGDGATEVAEYISDACGFTDYNNNNNGFDTDKVGSTKGMRACIVYNLDNGDQILFPLGAEGQGRRARTIDSDFIEGAGSGSLTYSGYNGLLSPSRYRPLTYNLYRSPGALYWFKQPGQKDYSTGNQSHNVASWDINYYTLAFNPYSHMSLSNRYPSDINNLSDSSDALPIKLIYRE